MNMDQNETSLYQKYADTFRKSSNEYYHKHKDEISAKRKLKYQKAQRIPRIQKVQRIQKV